MNHKFMHRHNYYNDPIWLYSEKKEYLYKIRTKIYKYYNKTNKILNNEKTLIVLKTNNISNIIFDYLNDSHNIYKMIKKLYNIYVNNFGRIGQFKLLYYHGYFNIIDFGIIDLILNLHNCSSKIKIKIDNETHDIKIIFDSELFCTNKPIGFIDKIYQ
jgi:hypothetical protein